MIIDTQEVIALIDKHTPPPYDGPLYITSTTAQELFRLRVKKTGHSAYWIPALQRLNRSDLMDRREWRSLAKIYSSRSHSYRGQHLEKQIVDFGLDYPPAVELGHKSIAKIINDEKAWVLPICADAARIKFSREIKKRVDYIETHGIRCKSLTEESIATALPMFHAFTRNYTMKTDYRNSLNDIFILAVSSHLEIPLLTRDKLLARFSEEYLYANLNDAGDRQIISTRKKNKSNQRMSESKRYVNRSWRITQGKR